MPYRSPISFVLVLLLLVLLPAGADAARLEPGPDAPFWAHLGADALLLAHIGGGLIGLLTGVVAVAARKGAPVHRLAGRLFLWSMAVAYVVGAGVAPFLTVGQRPNFIAGVLALYLLVTGVGAARRRDFRARRGDAAGALVPLAVMVLGALFMVQGSQSDSGTVDGSPPQAFVMFLIVGACALGGDLNVLLRRELTAPMRTARHLWRMCTSFFMASGSLFLGQPQVFPAWFVASPLPALLAFAPLFALGFWMVRTRLAARARRLGSVAGDVA
jgi:uncharacterized membrane protein